LAAPPGEGSSDDFSTFYDQALNHVKESFDATVRHFLDTATQNAAQKAATRDAHNAMALITDRDASFRDAAGTASPPVYSPQPPVASDAGTSLSPVRGANTIAASPPVRPTAPRAEPVFTEPWPPASFPPSSSIGLTGTYGTVGVSALEAAAKLFARLDQNHDGVVDQGEW